MDSFVALDFETANEQRGSACSAAFVKFSEQGEEIARFMTLLRPHESLFYFNPGNTWVHGMTAQDVLDAPNWNDVYEEVTEFIGDLPIVAHNMAFDGYVLTDLDGLYQKESIKNRRYCTLRLARKLFPEMPRRNLPEVFTHYFPNETFEHHEAWQDAWACGKIFAEMQREHGIQLLDQLCPPTGPGTHRPRTQRKRDWLYDPSVQLELSKLVEEFSGTNALLGHRIVFTGTFKKAKRAVMETLVKELGGTVQREITAQTTILVVGIPNPAVWRKGASGSKKMLKAFQMREAGSPITVMSEEEFLHFLYDRQQ